MTEYRYRPVADVIEELKYNRIKNVLFADSTFAGKKSHTIELLEALIPLKVRWSALWSSNLCRDQRFLDLAKRSGLLHVNIGLETVDRETLAGMNKKINKFNYYKEIIDNLRKRGISYSFNFVFGYDTEDESIYDQTLAFLRENKVPAAYFNILTPHKGTPLYDRLQSEGRLIDPDNIGRWPGLTCYFRPTHCTPMVLERKSGECTGNSTVSEVNDGPTGISDQQGRFCLLGDQLFSKENVPFRFRKFRSLLNTLQFGAPPWLR